MGRAVSIVIGVLAAGLLAASSTARAVGAERAASPLDALKQRYAARHVPSVDHSKLEALERRFASPRDVTTACLSCHTERGAEVMASSHWNWSRREYIPGRGIRSLGKRNAINNFCIGVSGNLGGCDSCHAGYGMVDAGFDFRDPRNIDCLACHDTTNTYVRVAGGLPAPSVDLRKVAQSAGRPTRATCGTCHFFGGGGNNVKHGDLEQALFEPGRELDVHMASDGPNLQCVDCHAAENHRLRGKLYSLSSMNRGRVTCEQCHTSLPHDNGLLNEHTVKVACQTCHIPAFARANATKTVWDWSTAGRLRGGEPFEEKDAIGNVTYASIKGTFTWKSNVVPDYAWFNGTADHYLLGDRVPAGAPVALNTLHGSYSDLEARIVPVKTHRAKQIYDPANGYLIQPKLYAPGRGEGAFWRDFDWNRAADAGMRAAGLPYSGTYTFVETRMTWPINHMVAPKERALTCSQCHSRGNSRLAGLTGFYMPGRDRSRAIDLLGGTAVLGALAGGLAHGAARIVTRRRRNRR
jgi:octaheme c-type cytochrome (tetrathionate reductase family)